MDYTVRGFTRDILGEKHFIDHQAHSIQDFVRQDILNQYQIIDVNVYQENIFHSKMIIKDTLLDNYLFGAGEEAFSQNELVSIRKKLKKEMLEIFYGRNLDTINPGDLAALQNQ